MENRKCPVLVDGKECGLALTLAERDTETATEVYECLRGHRTSVPLGVVEKRKCSTLVDGKQCGLALSVVERDLETGTQVYECALGHRTRDPLDPEVVDNSS